MSSYARDSERRMQDAAERATSATDNATVARHRYVLHAIRSLPVPTPPSDFAQQMEAALRDYPEEAGAERWLLLIVALATAVLVAATLLPWLASSTTTLPSSLTATMANVPWRFLTALAIGLGGFACFDALRVGQRAASGA